MFNRITSAILIAVGLVGERTRHPVWQPRG